MRRRAREGNNGSFLILPKPGKSGPEDIIIEDGDTLALEGHRCLDLVRTDKARPVLAHWDFAGKHELFPIPQNEIDISRDPFNRIQM